MGSLSVHSSTTLTPVASQPKAVAQQPQPAAQAPAQQSALGKDILQWKDIPTSTRIGKATSTTFKQTVVPFAIGGALAPPLAGAAIGGFIGLFSGQPGKFAVEGMKLTAKYMPVGAAVGVAAAGVDAAVVGSVVGSSPDKQAAMTRLGVGTAVLGLLAAEDAWDVVGAGASGAAQSLRAGRIFEQTEAALLNNK